MQDIALDSKVKFKPAVVFGENLGKENKLKPPDIQSAEYAVVL